MPNRLDAGAVYPHRSATREGRSRCGVTRWLAAALFVVPIALAATAQPGAAQDKPPWLNQTEWNFVKGQRAIFVAPDPSFPPIEEIDARGAYHGIAADYVRLIESKLGIRFSVINLETWDAVLEAARMRHVDLLPAAANTPRRQEFLLFSSPHLVLPGVIITRSNVPGDLSLTDLYGKKVAVVSGYLWQELIESGHSAIQVVPVQNLLTALNMASLGSVDAVIETLPVVIDVIHKAGIGNLRVAGETGFFTHLSFATRKDWPLLSSVIEKTLAQITPDERRAIYSKWISLQTESRPTFPWQTFWRVVAAVVVLAALLALVTAVWIRSLRRQVRLRTGMLDRQTVELRQSEERLRDFAEASSDWFWEMNENLVVSYLSANFTTVTGVDVAQVIGKDCDSLIASTCGDISIEDHKAHLRKRLPYRDFQFEIALSGRPSLYVSTSGRPALDHDGRFIGYRGTGNDITEKRRLQDTIALAEARAHQAQKMEAVGQMTGGIAHDFNNLLQVILSNADDLESASPQGSDSHRAAQQIRFAGERAARLTKHLLAFARRQPLQPVPMNLVEMVESLRPLLQRVLGESIELRCALPPAALLALADRAQIESSLVNLALNARDAMPGGGVFTVAVDAIEAAANIRAKFELAHGTYSRLRVSDTGVGMSPEVMEKAFEPIFTTKDVGKGSGLGLSMVFGFAKQSGGHAELDSRPGHGTTVTILLPPAESAARVETEPEIAEAPPASGPATILLVEDNDLVRPQVAMAIRALGYDVIEAEDGPSALQQLAQPCRIDLLFTDIVMPGGINGRELAAKACAIRSGLRVLFTSGYADNVLTREEQRDGVRLIAKPYRGPELARVLRDVLADEAESPAARAASTG